MSAKLVSARWLIIITISLSILKDLVAPYVKFPLPIVVVENSKLIFLCLVALGIVLLLFDSRNEYARKQKIENEKATVAQSSERTLFDLAFLLAKVFIGIFFALIVTLFFCALKSAIFSQPVGIQYITVVYSAAFLCWIVYPWKSI